MAKGVYRRFPDASPGAGPRPISSLCVFDEKRDHYLLLKYGWPQGKHAHYTKLHVRIMQNKIWIEEDMTEDGLGNELIAAGIPKEDIVGHWQSFATRLVFRAGQLGDVAERTGQEVFVQLQWQVLLFEAAEDL